MKKKQKTLIASLGASIIGLSTLPFILCSNNNIENIAKTINSNQHDNFINNISRDFHSQDFKKIQGQIYASSLRNDPVTEKTISELFTFFADSTQEDIKTYINSQQTWNKYILKNFNNIQEYPILENLVNSSEFSMLTNDLAHSLNQIQFSVGNSQYEDTLLKTALTFALDGHPTMYSKSTRIGTVTVDYPIYELSRQGKWQSLTYSPNPLENIKLFFEIGDYQKNNFPEDLRGSDENNDGHVTNSEFINSLIDALGSMH